ncbi:MAG: hypothetical protein LM590_00920 [Thermofilum sp.]|jgi:hypothetical protein|nr:hypothetical protein [Thermofilum sp.]
MSDVSRLIEKVSSVVPGFMGYKGNSFLQDDRLIRKKLLAMVNEARIKVERISSAVKQKSVSAGLRLDDLRIELLKVAQLLKRYSYSSESTGLTRVKDEFVQEILEEDVKLLSYASRMFEKVVILTPTLEPKELLEKVNETISLVNEMEAILRKRENLLLKAVSSEAK